MKKYVLMFTVFFIGFMSFGQQMIYFTNGDSVLGKIAYDATDYARITKSDGKSVIVLNSMIKDKSLIVLNRQNFTHLTNYNHLSIGWCGSTKAIWGLMLIKQIKNDISIFVDFKSNWNNIGVSSYTDGSYGIYEWESQPMTWESGQKIYFNGLSYKQRNNATQISTGSTEYRNIFDIGIIKTIAQKAANNLQLWLGAGVFKSHTLYVTQTFKGGYLDTHYEYLGLDVTEFDPTNSNSFSYTLSKEEYKNNLNITGGFLYKLENKNMSMTIGLGLDSNPNALVFMIGVGF